METQLIRQRSPVQIGPASDPLQAAEKTHKNTLRILKILRDREYPSVLTTKFPDMLCDPAYLRALDGLPLVVQCSLSSVNPGILRRLEPGAPSLPERLKALETLNEAGAVPMLRLWPYASDLAGSAEDIGQLLALAHDSGVKRILCNPLKLYHSGGCRERINQALGRDYLTTTSLRYVNGGLFSVASYPDQIRELQKLNQLCRLHGLDLLTCDDFIHTRAWRDCCGVGDLPGFHPSPWAYYLRGYVINQLTSFEEYMGDLPCPWRTEFEEEWNKGRLSRALPELTFHEEDKTYSRLEI